MKKILFSPENCTGCCACLMACLDQRDIDTAAGQKPLRYMTSRVESGLLKWKSVGCVHCGACAGVCPAGALVRDEATGYVLQKQEACIACGACAEACPLGVISLRPDTGCAMKCDGCAARLEAGLLPACVHTCPTGALRLAER